MRKCGLILMAVMAAGCSGSTNPRVTLSARAGSRSALSHGMVQSALQVGEVTVDSVKLVIRRVELEMVTVPANGSTPAELEEHELSVGPFLVELSGAQLDSGQLVKVFDAELPAGTYEEIEFEVHKVTQEDADATPALAAMLGKSIEITGTGKNGPFTFSSDLDEEQEREGPFTAGGTGEGSGGGNITFNIDLTKWFVAPNADPSVQGFDRHALEEAIEKSIDVYDDDDQDGVDD